MRHTWAPLLRVVADEVRADAGLPFQPNRSRAAGALHFHAHQCVFRAAAQRHHRLAGHQEHGVAGGSGHKLDLGIGLPQVRLEVQRELPELFQHPSLLRGCRGRRTGGLKWDRAVPVGAGRGGLQRRQHR